MGKGGSAKVEVTYYYMSIYFGICIAVDKLLAIIIKEKTAWEGELDAQTDLDIQLRDLFGGDKKEGGAIGNVTFLPGADDQVMPDHLATRMGRANGADCVAYRGVSSLFFHRDGTSSSNGFYWGANNPYLPGVWAKVRRAPKGLDPSLALIFTGTRTPRAICFALDKSSSMAGTRLATLKSAMSTVLNLISASAESGVLIDLAVVTFGDPSTSITRRTIDASDVDAVDAFVQALVANALDTDFRAGMNAAKTFFDATDAGITERFLFFITDGEPADSGGDSASTVASAAAATLATMTGVDSYGINIVLADTTYTAQIDNTASDGVPVVDEDDESGLVSAVTNALFGDDVVGDANPAHIIYECLTNTDWGMGSPPAAIDYDSFDAASLTLWAESFGLSLLWTRQAAITDFVQEILDHIQAVLYVEPSTGLLTLSLIRDDYDPDALEEITPDNADLTSFQRKLWGEIVNEIVVTWTNPENEQEETVSAQDLASIAMQGGVVSDSRNYYGVRNAELAQSLAWRDLRSAGQPLASCTAEVDRTMWASRPGRCVKLTWPEYGLSELVMRIVNVEYGQPGDATIKLELIEDVYGLDIGTYDSPPATEWTDPSADPEPMTPVDIVTMPLFLAAQSTVAAFVDSPEYPEVVAGILATTDVSDAYEYQLWDEVALANGDLEWQQLTANNVIGHGVLDNALAAEVTSTGVSFSSLTGSTLPTVAGFVFLGDAGETGNEIAMIDAESGTYTLVRGVLDTVPRAWPAGTPVWFVDGSTVWEDPTVRAAGETVDYKLLPRTSKGVLALGSASLESATLTERPWLPNRPANVTAYGGAWSSLAAPIDALARPDPWVTVTWANRNRIEEDSQVLAWTDASQTPETGQTTRIEVLALDGTPLVTHDSLTGTSFDVPNSSFGGEPVVRIQVHADRADSDGDFSSLQHFEHWVRVYAEGGDRITETDDARVSEAGDRRVTET